MPSFLKGDIKWLDEVAGAKDEWGESQNLIRGPEGSVVKSHCTAN